MSEPAAEAKEPLAPFGEGVWLGTSPVSIVGMRLATTMTVLRLGDGGLLVYSPCALTPRRRAAVDALGPVRHLYAPNLFHHRWVGDWAAAFPSARLHAPRGLARKRRDLRIDRVHGEAPDPALAPDVDELPIDGFRLREGVIIHRASRTLVVADLIHNVGRPVQPWAVLYTRLMGFYDRVALSRVIRWTGFDDHAAARRCIDAVLARPFDRLVVGHGAPLASGAHEAVAAGYAWLR
jgi:hypothetical protein